MKCVPELSAQQKNSALNRIIQHQLPPLLCAHQRCSSELCYTQSSTTRLVITSSTGSVKLHFDGLKWSKNGVQCHGEIITVVNDHVDVVLVPAVRCSDNGR